MAAPYLPTIGAPFPAGIDLQGSELARVTLWNVTIASGLLPIDGALGYRTNAGDKGPIFYDSAIAAEERLVRRSLHEAIGGQYQFNYNSGAPFTVVNQTVVTNLNADLLDGYNSSATAVQNTIPIYSTGGTLFVSTPTLGGHAVNKDYADALGAGINPATGGSARVATVAAIPNLSNASVTIDGVVLVEGERVLVKDTASPDGIIPVHHKYDGIYVVGVVVGGAAPFTRATDSDTTAELDRQYVLVTEGDTNIGDSFFQTTNDPVVGTDALNYTLFYSPVVYLAGNGIKKTGVTFSVKINGDDSYLTNSIIYASSSSVLNETALNATATNKFLRQVSSGVPSFEQVLAADIGSGAALTKGDDTNVTLTLGGTPTTALLAAASITAGWTGILSVARGGTGVVTLADGGLVIGNVAGAVEVVAAGLTTQILVGGGALTAPVWGTDLPTAVTIGTAYIYRIGGTDVSLADGGTSASLTASVGGIFYSTASAGAILSGTATAGQIIRSGASAAPTWSTSIYPATNAVNTLLYASSADVMAALATANSGVLVTSGAGVPSIATDIPTAVTIGGAYIYRVGGTDVSVADGGTGQSTATAGFNALSPMTTLGDVIYGGASGAGTRLAGNITAVKQFLSQTGTGAVSAAPAWATIVPGDISSPANLGIGTSLTFTAGDGVGSVLQACSINAIQDIRTTASPTFVGATLSGHTAIRILYAGTAGLVSSNANLTYDATTLQVLTGSTTASSKALVAIHTGAVIGTGYAASFTKSGAGTTNVGLYLSASGATNNYGLIVENGKVGIETSTPLSLLTVGSFTPIAAVGIPAIAATGTLYLTGTFPNLGYDDASQAANARLWQEGPLGNLLFKIRALDDAGNNTGDAMVAERNAGTYTIKQVYFPNGNIGIGTTTPLGILHTAVNTASNIYFQAATAGPVSILARYSNGTVTSPTEVVDTNGLLLLKTQAYSGAQWFTCAGIEVDVNGTFTSGQRPPTRLALISNAANGAVTIGLYCQGAGVINLPQLTASTILALDANKNIISGSALPSGSIAGRIVKTVLTAAMISGNTATQTHNLNTNQVNCQVQKVSTKQKWYPDLVAATNSVAVDFKFAPGDGEFEIITCG